jgi:Fe-S cluster assembly iron-binding protein IscA
MTQAKPLTMELTPAAEKFIRRMMRLNADATAGFRLKVRPGGCSGLAVEFDLAAEPGLDEVVWEHAKLRIFVDSRSLTGFVVTTPGGTAQACSPASTLVPIEALTRR